MELSFNGRRFYEPILLGVLANFLATYLLKPTSPDYAWNDFIIACLLAIPITEFNRYINYNLDRKYPWQDKPIKRLVYQFLYTAMVLIVTLNVIGNAYIWMSKQSFFSLHETLLVNGATLAIATLLTAFNVTNYFYTQWRDTSLTLQESFTKIQDLQLKIKQSSQSAEFQKGRSKVSIELKNIRLVQIESGVVRAFLEDGQHVLFPGTLRQLLVLLPNHLFFPITRDTIIHRETIKSISPSLYGKIQIEVKNLAQVHCFTISRLKASSFRKWYSNSI